MQHFKWIVLLVTTCISSRVHADTEAVPGQFGAADLLSVGGSTLLVLAAIVTLAWFYKRSQQYRGAAGELINIIAAQSLGPKERILLVDVAGEQLVLGMTASQVQTLHVLSEPIEPTETTSNGFASRLRSAFKEAAGK